MNTNLNKILIQLCEIKEQKIDAVRNQEYEKALKLREIERNLQREAYCLLFKSGGDSYDWKKYEEGIVKYFKDNYDIDYHSINSPAQINRIIKLGELGI